MTSPSGVVVGLLFASCGFEPEVVNEAELLEVLPGLNAPVATTGHLIAMKVLSRNDWERPQDRMGLGALIRVATLSDLEGARLAFSLCRDRGFNGGRDLEEDLRRLQRELN